MCVCVLRKKFVVKFLFFSCMRGRKKRFLFALFLVVVSFFLFLVAFFVCFFSHQITNRQKKDFVSFLHFQTRMTTTIPRTSRFSFSSSNNSSTKTTTHRGFGLSFKSPRLRSRRLGLSDDDFGGGRFRRKHQNHLQRTSASSFSSSSSTEEGRRREEEDKEEKEENMNSVESLAISALQTATRSSSLNNNNINNIKNNINNSNNNVVKLNKTRALFNAVEDSFQNKQFIDEKPPVLVREGRIYESKYASVAKSAFLFSVTFGIFVAALRIYFGLCSSGGSSTYYFDFQLNRFSTSKVLALCVDAVADSIVYAICIAPALPALALTCVKIRLNARLREASAFLPYSLAPFAAKDANEQINRRRAMDVSANVKRHREFAKLKTLLRDCAELRFSFALSVLEANRTLAFVALAFKTLALGFGPSRYASPSLFFLDACLSACAFCAAIVATALTRDETNVRRKIEEETRFLEREYLLAQHKGTFLCRWESDPYDEAGNNKEGAPSERNLVGVDKAITNSAVGEASQLSVLELGVSQERCLSLTLDAKDGLTSSELTRRGFTASSVFIPNPYSSVVYALRNGTFSVDNSKKENAFTGTVESYLASRDPASESFQVVYLDHCGAVMQRTQQIYDLFSRHAVNDNGIFAVTFSTRGKRAGWSKDEAVRFAAETIHDAATKHGYVLEGNAAPSMPGLVDYTISSSSSSSSSSGVSNLRASNEESKVLKAMSSNLMKQDDVALALCSLKWANLEQTESELALETWKSQRRRQLLFDAAKTVATKASKKSNDDGLSGGSVSTSAELRKLRSLAREVLDARTKTSALGGGSGGGASSSSLTGVMVDASNSITYPKVLYLYGTLMFFVFKVRCYRAGR